MLSGVISKTAAYGFLRIALPIFPEPVATMRDTILVLAAIGLVYGSLLAFRAARLPRRDRVLEPGADVPDRDRALRRQRLGRPGRAAPDGQPRPHLGRASSCSPAASSGAPATGEFALLGGMARGGPILATVLITTGVIALAVPGSSRVRRRVPDPQRHLHARLGLGRRRRDRDRARRHVHAARDLGGAARGEGPGGPRSRAATSGPPRSACSRPLVAVLLFLSFWPAGVTDHSFGGEPSDVRDRRAASRSPRSP